jgi:hypothetical protein
MAGDSVVSLAGYEFRFCKSLCPELTGAGWAGTHQIVNDWLLFHYSSATSGRHTVNLAERVIHW